MDTSVSILSSELFFLILCIFAAYIEKNLFKYNHSFKHWWGITIYFILLGIDFWLFRNPFLVFACLLIGEVVFSPFLNLIRGHEFFYTNTKDPNGSSLDKLEGPTGRIIYFISLGSLITLNIIFFL